MHNVDTSAGTAICAAPPRMPLADLSLFEIPIDVFDRYGRIVDQDSDRQRQSAEGHDVDGFPSALSTQIDKNRKRDGDAMISVLRQLPRTAES